MMKIRFSFAVCFYFFGLKNVLAIAICEYKSVRKFLCKLIGVVNALGHISLLEKSIARHMMRVKSVKKKKTRERAPYMLISNYGLRERPLRCLFSSRH